MLIRVEEEEDEEQSPASLWGVRLVTVWGRIARLSVCVCVYAVQKHVFLCMAVKNLPRFVQCSFMKCIYLK